MKIRKHLVGTSVRNKVTYGGTNGRKYITVHETDNPNKGADADAHARLQANGNSRAASWHWQVDDKEAVQSFDHAAQCWAGGDGSGNGNTNSIHVEICVNSDGNYRKAVENAAELVRKIMKDEGIPVNNVVQHNRWSGKNCPRNLRGGSKGINWNGFISLVKGEEVAKPSKSKPKTTKPKSSVSSKSYLSRGDSGVAVRKMQNRLIKAGYSVGKWGADGVFGSATDKALR